MAPLNTEAGFEPTPHLELIMGEEVRNNQFALDLPAGARRPHVILCVGMGVQGLHRPSPPLSRDDVLALRRFVRFVGPVPTSLEAWWLDQDKPTRADLKLLLRSLSFVDWLWWAWKAQG